MSSLNQSHFDKNLSVEKIAQTLKNENKIMTDNTWLKNISKFEFYETKINLL